MIRRRFWARGKMGQMRTHVERNFHGHGLSRLVAAALEAEGFQVAVSPPGPDGGVDIRAGKGPMGFDSPRRGQESGPAGGAAGPRRLLPRQYSGRGGQRGQERPRRPPELLDLLAEGDTLVVTHIDRLSRGLTHGLQVIEGLHRAGVEFWSLSEDFNTATATGKLQLTMVLAFSEWWRNSIRERSVAGQAKARAEGRFPGRRPSLTERQREYIRAERSKGVSQRELAKRLDVSRWTIQQADR